MTGFDNGLTASRRPNQSPCFAVQTCPKALGFPQRLATRTDTDLKVYLFVIGTKQPTRKKTGGFSDEWEELSKKAPHGVPQGHLKLGIDGMLGMDGSPGSPPVILLIIALDIRCMASVIGC